MTTAPLLKTADAQAALAGIIKAFGLDPAQAAPAVASLAESVTSRLTRLTLSRGGIADIIDLMGDANAQKAIADPNAAADPAVVDEGNHVLDVLIGDKHISRGIAARAASQSGIGVDLAKKLLPVVATMMVGGLQKQAAPQLSKISAGIPALAVSNPGNPLPVPGDNIPGVGRRAPNNPFENLPDIIRRGGTQAPGGGSLEAVIRQILGSLLGNGNRGVIGTMIQGLILRWVVNFIRRMFMR